MVATALPSRTCAFRSQKCARISQSAHVSRLSVTARCAAVKDEAKAAVVKADEPVFEDSYEIATLSVDQVHELIKTVSEETTIAEVHLKLADLEVKFRRSSGNLPAVAAAPAAAAAPAVDYNAMSASLPPAPASRQLESLDDDDVNESVVAVHSPKVGTMCVHKYVKGNRVSKEPLVKVGSKVKKGQTIAFIGQLGTHVPVEAPHAGEITEIVKQDGEAVEYDAEVMRMVPFFGGHIIGDSKLA